MEVKTEADTAKPKVLVVGSRVTLRVIEEGDLDDLVACANDPAVAENLRDLFPHPYTKERAKEWLAICQSQPVPTNLGIIVDGRYAGSIGGSRHTDVHRFTAEVGYWLGKQHWGQGYATEALRLFVDYMFRTFTDVIRIEGGCYHRNAASARVLVKAGFTFEGRLRHSAVKNGVVLDQLMHSILREEWVAATVADGVA